MLVRLQGLRLPTTFLYSELLALRCAMLAGVDLLEGSAGAALPAAAVSPAGALQGLLNVRTATGSLRILQRAVPGLKALMGHRSLCLAVRHPHAACSTPGVIPNKAPDLFQHLCQS